MSDILPENDDITRRIAEIASHYEAILHLLGEDPKREGLLKTPERAAKALLYATGGYNENVEEIVNGAMFHEERSGMVIVRDIEFYSFCEHHILPFFGHVSIGYMPNSKIIGLSKLARIVNMFARRLQVQERMTAEICTTIADLLDARGVIVRCTGRHLCMQMRGVEKQDSHTVTTEMTGLFITDNSLREEFFSALN